MKVVIFCGGIGTRLKELTEELPKPLIEVGGKPVLWHIMKIYSYYGFNDFILCLGYKGEKIKEYFIKSDWRDNDFTIRDNKLKLHTNKKEDWSITFVDTGEAANKGERLMKIKDYIDDNDFLVAYGDDLSNINLSELINFHKKIGKIATITTIQLNSPYGIIEFDSEGIIKEFKEKPLMKEWINGGYMIFNKKIFDYIKPGDDLEKEVFDKLVKQREICAFKHYGFWKGMSTLKDTQELNELWKNGKAEWKVW